MLTDVTWWEEHNETHFNFLACVPSLETASDHIQQTY